MDKEKTKSTVESLLFVSGEPVKAQKLAKICQISKNEVEQAIAELQKEYEGKRGLRIISKGDEYQIGTNPENSEHVGRMVSGELSSELSKSAMETLAIVAYKGPITRLQIEALRGVNCSYVLRTLLMRGLVERKETSDVRGYLYEISFEFLKSMGFQKASDFPDWENLSKDEKVSDFLSLSSKTEQESA